MNYVFMLSMLKVCRREGTFFGVSFVRFSHPTIRSLTYRFPIWTWRDLVPCSDHPNLFCIFMTLCEDETDVDTPWTSEVVLMKVRKLNWGHWRLVIESNFQRVTNKFMERRLCFGLRSKMSFANTTIYIWRFLHPKCSLTISQQTIVGIFFVSFAINLMCKMWY